MQDKPTYAAATQNSKQASTSGISRCGEKGGVKDNFNLVFYAGMGNPAQWIRGAYCHSCGFGTNHPSDKRKRKGDKHKTEATRDSIMGGATRNKDWESKD